MMQSPHRRTGCVARLWTALLLLLLLLASSCAAKPSFTFSNFTVVPGEPFNLTWTGASGPVDINIASGTEDAVKVVWWIARALPLLLVLLSLHPTIAYTLAPRGKGGDIRSASTLTKTCRQ